MNRNSIHTMKGIHQIVSSSPNYALIASSMLFLLPSMYAYYKNKNVLSMVSLCNTLCSIYYWINPVYGLSRNLDLIVSKVGGVIYFFYGYRNIHSSLQRLLGYSNLMLLLQFYFLSCKTYSKNKYQWIYYHVGFHICSCIGKLIVLF
jgi:predicted ATPase